MPEIQRLLKIKQDFDAKFSFDLACQKDKTILSFLDEKFLQFEKITNDLMKSGASVQNLADAEFLDIFSRLHMLKLSTKHLMKLN